MCRAAMFDLGVAVAGGRQTLFVVKRSLRSAWLPIEIEIAADNRVQRPKPSEKSNAARRRRYLLRARTRAVLCKSRIDSPNYFGNNTVSITWITPFEAFTSAVVTFAPLTVTPIASALTSSDWPLTVEIGRAHV